MATRRFLLRPRRTMYAAIALFAACAVFLGHHAATNDRGLVIEWLIHLSRGEATVFWGVLAWCSIAFVIVGGIAIFRMRGGRLAVELDDTGITLPGAPIRPRPRRFAFAEITSAMLSTVQKQEFLTVVGPAGRASLARSHVGDREFDEIVAVVAAHVPAPRAALPRATLR